LWQAQTENANISLNIAVSYCDVYLLGKDNKSPVKSTNARYIRVTEFKIKKKWWQSLTVLLNHQTVNHNTIQCDAKCAKTWQIVSSIYCTKPETRNKEKTKNKDPI